MTNKAGYPRFMPDFKAWAKNILDRDELEEALIDAFSRGYEAGYLDGKDFGWIEEQDKHG